MNTKMRDLQWHGNTVNIRLCSIYFTSHCIVCMFMKVFWRRISSKGIEFGNETRKSPKPFFTSSFRMQKKVLSIAGLIRGAMRAAATLDAVISLAISAREFGWDTLHCLWKDFQREHDVCSRRTRRGYRMHRRRGIMITLTGTPSFLPPSAKVFLGDKRVWLSMTDYIRQNKRGRIIWHVKIITFIANE